jgi:hypothetical protein
VSVRQFVLDLGKNALADIEGVGRPARYRYRQRGKCSRYRVVAAIGQPGVRACTVSMQ